ncbi:Pyridoxal phosphate homeostasis protein [Mycena indigotica]|uniref:Pyridoxal phosphate homeostasis protein n=1 Tax=Mycena indigotica TaxID=2126181 RepID=A0A8H6T8F1_9AGAR|nr:Pyridoxal phosphate homeostasis protein [Mycena indigotica]KAF7312679.1 Pyridoxal phosphate homeostasis protein [Mycena indigotica]
MSTGASDERKAELAESLAEIRSRVASASSGAPTLVAVSKYKPASDIQACFEQGQLDFGENYVQELVDKAKELSQDIRWHFIGTLQSNKAKTLAAIPNLYSIHTLTSMKTATLLNNALPSERKHPLNVLLQINTSGEDSKSGLSPLLSKDDNDNDLVKLAKHIVTSCPQLRLDGLMTIGALEQSLSDDENADFVTLTTTRDLLELQLQEDGFLSERRLLLSMGMSSDFEAALKAGSNIVRVGTGIFGARATKQ